jgi:tetratricopeptide (TPR) repeat protein
VEKQDEADRLLDIAEDAVDKRNWALALAAVEAVLARGLRRTGARIWCARVYAELRRFDEARVLLEPHLEAGPAEVRRAAVGEWARLHRLRGDYAVAERWYRRLCELSPGSTTPFVFLGSTLARQGRFAEAEAVYRRATTLDGNPHEAWLNVGHVLRAQGRFGEALEAVREALRIDPEHEAATRFASDLEEALRFQAVEGGPTRRSG